MFLYLFVFFCVMFGMYIILYNHIEGDIFGMGCIPFMNVKFPACIWYMVCLIRCIVLLFMQPGVCERHFCMCSCTVDSVCRV